MSITSVSYLIMIAIGAIIYYILPKAWQWVELLVMSLLFYFCSATPYTILYLLISTLVAYIATCYTGESTPPLLHSNKRIKQILVIVAIIINVALWFALKGSAIWGSIVYHLHKIFPCVNKMNALPYVAALGMGYYTCQIIGYILDCYWGNIKPQKNPLKLLLFLCFFPQMTTGPISRYNNLQSLYEYHSFSYKNLTYGAQRILWGFFKKLVLAENAGSVVNAIWLNLNDYVGVWRWIALLLFPIQMYADFSGCMDIVLGTAEIFGIKLPENFNVPFFSRTIQEFWQRWHITLGTWAKDYVLYPLLKSKVMIEFAKIAKKKFGKKMGKFVATAVGMFVLWMIMGLWHGAFKYVIGVSLWYWILLMLGELCSPGLKKLSEILHIKENFSWHLFQSARTYLIYAIGAVFFRAPSIGVGLQFVIELKQIFSQETCNPWILFDGSILGLGIHAWDLNICIIAVVFLIIAGILRERYGHARDWLAEQNWVFRWGIWLMLGATVLIFGKYGPGYSAAEFIYQGF